MVVAVAVGEPSRARRFSWCTRTSSQHNRCVGRRGRDDGRIGCRWYAKRRVGRRGRKDQHIGRRSHRDGGSWSDRYRPAPAPV